MILSRVIEHARTQSWTAVVLGVFIGIQLGNWNEARLKEAEDLERSLSPN